MMTAGEARGLTTLLASMRDEWPQSSILVEVNKLADEGYSTVDLTTACTEVAANRKYKSPAVLTMIVPELISGKHRNDAPRTPGPHRRDDSRLCDVCNTPEHLCQSSASNRGGRDHAFVTVSDMDAVRDAQRANGILDRARAEAIREFAKTQFKLPPEVEESTSTADEPAA